MVMDQMSCRSSTRYPGSEVARPCGVPPLGTYHHHIELKQQGLASMKTMSLVYRLFLHARRLNAPFLSSAITFWSTAKLRYHTQKPATARILAIAWLPISHYGRLNRITVLSFSLKRRQGYLLFHLHQPTLPPTLVCAASITIRY
jgi:hypothetical protein